MDDLLSKRDEEGLSKVVKEAEAELSVAEEKQILLVLLRLKQESKEPKSASLKHKVLKSRNQKSSTRGGTQRVTWVRDESTIGR